MNISRTLQSSTRLTEFVSRSSSEFVPAIAFGLTSLSGIIAAAMTTSMFSALRDDENAGTDSIIAAFDKLEGVVLAVLGLSIAVGVAQLSFPSFGCRLSGGLHRHPASYI